MENFSALFGGGEPPPPTTAASLGFGPGKPGSGPAPAPTGTPGGEEAARKAATAASGPFYLMRELPGSGRWGAGGLRGSLANRHLEAGIAVESQREHCRAGRACRALWTVFVSLRDFPLLPASRAAKGAL